MYTAARRIQQTNLYLIAGGKKPARKRGAGFVALFLTLAILLLTSISQTLQLRALQSDLRLLEKNVQTVRAEHEELAADYALSQK